MLKKICIETKHYPLNVTYVIPISTPYILSLEQIYFQRSEFQLKPNKAKIKVLKIIELSHHEKFSMQLKNLSYSCLICFQQKLKCIENLKHYAKESVVV